MAQQQPRVGPEPPWDFTGIPVAEEAAPGAPPSPFDFTGIAEAPGAPDQATLRGAQTAPLRRFAGEAFQAGVVEPLTGLGQIARSVVTEGPIDTAVSVGKALAAPTTQHLAAASDARRRGDWNAWVQNMFRAVPIVGPIGEQIGEQLEAGDVAGGLGRATGIAGTFALPGVLRGVRATKPTGLVPLTRGERTGSGLAQFVENISERTFPGTSIWRRFRDFQQRRLRQEGDRLVRGITQELESGISGVDDFTRFRAALHQSLADRKVAAGQLYDMIDQQVRTTTRRVAATREIPSTLVGPTGEALTTTQRFLRTVEVGGVSVPTRTIKQVAIPMLRRIRQESQIMPPGELARTQAILERIVGAPKEIGFAAFNDFRSDLLRIVRSHGDPMPGRAGGAAKFLASNADDALMSAAEKSGIPWLPERLRQANAIWRDAHTVFDMPIIKRLLEESPEVMPQVVRQATLEELALIQSVTPAPIFDAVRARLLQDILEESMTPLPPASAPSITGAVSDLMTGERTLVQTPQLSGTTLNNRIRNLGIEKATELFGAETVSGLQELSSLASRVRPRDANRVAGGLIAAGVNATLVSPLMAPLVRMAGLQPLQLVHSVGLSGSLMGLAYIITRPQGLTTYRAFLRAMGSGEARTAIFLGGRLAAMMTQEDDPAETPGMAPGTTLRVDPARLGEITGQPGVRTGARVSLGR